MSDSVLAVFLSCRFLVFFGADVAKSQVMTTCSFVGRSSNLMIGFPVSLEALSMPTRGAGRRYSSITLKVYSVRIDKGLSSSENRCLHFYLSIFLYVLTPEGDIRRVPGNQVLGLVFLFLLVFVQC